MPAQTKASTPHSRKPIRLNITPKLRKLLDIKPEAKGGQPRISNSSISKRIVDERGYLPAVADALGVRFEALSRAVQLDKVFAEAMAAAEELEIYEARKALREAVLNGDIQAIKFFLEHRDPAFADVLPPQEHEDYQTLAEAAAQAEAAGYVVLAKEDPMPLRDPPARKAN